MSEVKHDASFGEKEAPRDWWSHVRRFGGYALGAAGVGYGLYERARRKRAEAEKRIDDLTGVLTPQAFEDQLRSAIDDLHTTHRADDPHALALVFIDGDGFGAINKQHGHSAGNRAVKVMCEAVSSVIRKERDFVGRLGGDEFGVVLEFNEVDDMQEIIDALPGRVQAEINKRLEDYPTLERGDMPNALSVSMGADVMHRGDDKTFKELFDTANFRMRQAKERLRADQTE